MSLNEKEKTVKKPAITETKIEESENFADLISIPSVDAIEAESKETIELKKQLAEEAILHRYAEALRIYKGHLAARVRDLVPEKDRMKMAKISDEKAWGEYLRITAPPPNVGGNAKRYKLRCTFEKMFKDDRALILKITQEAAQANVKLDK